MTARLVLASASPGRLAMLTGAGITPSVVVSGVDETQVSAVAPADVAGELAARKAHAVANGVVTGVRRPADGGGAGSAAGAGGAGGAGLGALVLGCDSVLELDGAALGKPTSAAEALARWHAMAGRAGLLHTGHCVVDTATGREAAAVGTTVVHFGTPDEAELAAYVASGEPLRVAGAFAIDGLGGPFVERIEGDWGNVVGLSLPLLRDLLRRVGVRITDLWG